MRNRITPENITTLKPNEIFVFGSNTAGIHGGGAAKLAYEKFGAKCGYGHGHIGQTYAIPTKDNNIKTLDIEYINLAVQEFIRYVNIQNNIFNNDVIYLVTQIGCGLAGFKPEQIAPLFKNVINIENVYLPEVFWKILKNY
jgi:hypothetical protein